MVTIGIDPHKASHTAVALDEEGRLLGELRVVATKAMLERLLRWAERWPERIWAVEGATGLGHLLAQQLGFFQAQFGFVGLGNGALGFEVGGDEGEGVVGVDLDVNFGKAANAGKAS